MYKLGLVVLFASLVSGFEKINTQLVNKNVDRSIDLTTQLVKITASVTLENTGKESVRTFLVAVEPGLASNLSYIDVKDNLKDDLKLSLVEVEGHKDKVFYRVQLKQPLDAGRTTSIAIEQVYIKSLQPYPNTITQKEKQLVRYFGNHYFYSPYFTLKQKTEVFLASRNIESYSKLKPVTQSDSALTYGPYNAVQPFTNDQMIVHYENNSPFMTVTRIERTVEVSHWGNIAVEENIEIVHTGAKLKGPFSRYDYQRDASSVHHSVKSYRTVLPPIAHSIYYRDSNGNISTSAVRVRKEWIELELRPRFPLFGGWKSSYVLGYSVPSYQYLLKKSNGELLLSTRLLDHIFDDMYVEELETSIVLPVGVSNIKIKTPYEVERLADGITYKYLDNIGRTVVKLRKTNLVEQHIQDLEITYNWQPHLLLHEPVLLTLALFVLFVVVIVWVRLDFSIGKPEHSKKD